MSKIKYLGQQGPDGFHDKQHAGFFCPACKQMHYMGVGEHVHNQPKWSFNFDDEKPVFGPSLLCRWGHYCHPNKSASECKACQEKAAGVPEPERLYMNCGVCHSFIGCNGAQPGQIIFLGDCTHSMAGQVVDLPDVPTPEQERANYEDDERDSA